ncbi:MAG: ABC transporter permease [Chitinivibrionia bacterium]|nr:ABC transporter permease [Chitinivibrionia bacterium]
MNGIFTIFAKELKTYFISPIAYIFMIVYLLLTNFLFFQTFFLNNQAEMRSYFEFLPYIFLIFVPAITMRTWAEEKRNKTFELLLTLPLKDTQIVAGKFFAAIAFLAITLACSLTVPITIAVIGNPDVGVIIGGYFGAILLGAAYISIGMWISSLTENQIVALIGSIVVILTLLMIGHPIVLSFVPSELAQIFSFIGLSGRFESIGRGVIDSRDIIYYVSVIAFFLYLNVQSLQSRKWE